MICRAYMPRPVVQRDAKMPKVTKIAQMTGKIMEEVGEITVCSDGF